MMTEEQVEQLLTRSLDRFLNAIERIASALEQLAATRKEISDEAH